ncbi:MAG TPA: acyltransferase domain-containing protein [Thermoanaerobaculia bacterium]|jgi:acyl transferase domain-containing protein
MSRAETVFMFSGQGSQYYQMGRDLFEHDATFRRTMLRLDDLVRQIAGRSVVEQLYSEQNRKSDSFDRTLLTHPAIFMVEYSLAQTLITSGIVPDAVMGVSLGSFAAATVAGFMSVDDALTAVVRQAIAFEESCVPGGMMAVLAEPALYGEEFLRRDSELAAINFASHFVVSAKRPELDALEAALKGRGIGHQRLPVSFPYHSRWVEEARVPFQSFMRSIRYAQGSLPLVCCDDTGTLSELSPEYFWNVVRRPIRFRETTARLEQEGPRRYIDVGPAGTLATFLKYGLPATTRSTVHSILTPYGTDRKNLAALRASLAS